MHYAKIQDGVVVNVVVANADFALKHQLIPLSGEAGIGWTYANGVFTAPPQPEQTQE